MKVKQGHPGFPPQFPASSVRRVFTNFRALPQRTLRGQEVERISNLSIFLRSSQGVRRFFIVRSFEFPPPFPFKVSEVFFSSIPEVRFFLTQVFSTTFHPQLLLPAIPIHTLVGARVLEGRQL